LGLSLVEAIEPWCECWAGHEQEAGGGFFDAEGGTAAVVVIVEGIDEGADFAVFSELGGVGKFFGCGRAFGDEESGFESGDAFGSQECTVRQWFQRQGCWSMGLTEF
jgi:hypothetical protein